MNRTRNRIWIETSAGTFDKFSRVELVTDLFDLSNAVLEVGDDGAWDALEKVVAPGQPFRVYLNGRLQMTGRAEVNEVPIDADNGMVVRVTCRTKLADAKFSSADPKIKFTGVSIRDFILALFADHGYTADDFVFAPDVDRNLVTGKKGNRGMAPVDLEPMKLDQQKVNPPETVLEAATRVLARFHMTVWDAADGRVVIGHPDETQPPLYRFVLRRGPASRATNILNGTRVRDWSEVPSELIVFGGGFSKDYARAPMRASFPDLDLMIAAAANNGHFKRRVIVPAEGIKTHDQAMAHARREYVKRAKRKDGWQITTDSWTYWDGTGNTSLAINTVADVDIETVAGAGAGRFCIAKLQRRLDADGGELAQMDLIAPSTLEI